MSTDFNEIFSKLYFTKFKFVIKPVETIILPEFKGAMFRGALGNSLRKILCPNHKQNCLCFYSRIFEPVIDQSLKKELKISDNAPRGFIIEYPLTSQKKFTHGELLQFDLILVGNMVDYFHYFLLAFEQLGKRFGIGSWIEGGRGKFEIENVLCAQKQIYSGSSGILVNNFEKVTVSDIKTIDKTNSLVLNFITPLRIEREKKRIVFGSKNDFKTIAINLYRRLFLLQAIYCDGSTNYSHKNIEPLTEKVKLLRSSLKQVELTRMAVKKQTKNEREFREKVKMNYDGFIGQMEFEGETEPFLKMLLLGEHLHVGKYTTFGLGKYEIL